MFQEYEPLIELQAKAMGLPLIIQETAGEKEAELHDLENALVKAKRLYKIDGIVSGALFSTYQRDRIETICDKLGLKIFSPLWHKSQEQHLQELVRSGFEAIIVKIAAAGFDESWLGKKIDEKTIQDLIKLQKKMGLNIAGEGGEFESVVLSCPLFKKKIKIVRSHKVMESEHAGKLIIGQAELVEL